MPRKSIGIVAVHPETGEYLCRDNQWRALPHFGTLRTCAKTYVYPRAALKACERHRGSPVLPGATISECVHLYEGDELRRGYVHRARLKTCAECGEYWPCSDSKRTDINPVIRASHHC